MGKYHIKLYSPDKVYQGYLKSVSTYYGKIESTTSIKDAKSYAKQETAEKDVHLVMVMTHGGLGCEIG